MKPRPRPCIASRLPILIRPRGTGAFLPIVLLVFLLTAALAPPPNLAAQVLPKPEPVMPEEYNPENFPLWLRDVRRFEVIAAGSFPVTFAFAALIYDFSLLAANDFAPAFNLGTQRGEDDIAVIIGSAAAASVLIAAADLIISISKRSRAAAARDEKGQRGQKGQKGTPN